MLGVNRNEVTGEDVVESGYVDLARRHNVRARAIGTNSCTLPGGISELQSMEFGWMGANHNFSICVHLLYACRVHQEATGLNWAAR